MKKKDNKDNIISPWSFENKDVNKETKNEDREGEESKSTKREYKNFNRQSDFNNKNNKNPINDLFSSILTGNKPPKLSSIISGLFLIPLVIILVWASSGFYKVNTDEQAVELYFGKFKRMTNPGLHFILPKPFGNVIKRSVTTINKEEFGFLGKDTQEKNTSRFFSKNSRDAVSRNVEAESFMLTGDENIVDTDFEVQWRINNLKKYLFNLDVPKTTIRKSAESAIREIIGQKPIAEALSSGKLEIEKSVEELLQQTLDSYNSGIEITLVQLLRVDPPEQVINAFRDVQTAKADKEREINEAESYKNDIIPKARGKAQKIMKDAEGYKIRVVTDAEGQVNRFLKVYDQYRKNKYVTKKRIYLETMEEVYKNLDKIIVDEEVSKSGVVPYLPIDR